VGIHGFSARIDPIFAPQPGSIRVFEKDYLRPAIGDKNSLILVALNGEKVVGYSYTLIADSALEVNHKNFGLIHDLFVTQDSRRRGTGEKLYTEILKWFKAKGVNRVELSVIAKNEAACGFWRKHGYGDFQHTWYREI
jgi:diamine N-acetyltransferase